MSTGWTFAVAVFIVSVIVVVLALAYSVPGLAVMAAGITGVTMGRFAHLAGMWDAK